MCVNKITQTWVKISKTTRASRDILYVCLEFTVQFEAMASRHRIKYRICATDVEKLISIPSWGEKWLDIPVRYVMAQHHHFASQFSPFGIQAEKHCPPVVSIPEHGHMYREFSQAF